MKPAGSRAIRKLQERAFIGSSGKKKMCKVHYNRKVHYNFLPEPGSAKNPI